jgi:hypothetical protein
MQYQSEGVYRQNEIIASVTARYSRLSLSSFYTFNSAKADTSGVTIHPLRLILDSIMAGPISIYITALCSWATFRPRGSHRLHRFCP